MDEQEKEIERLKEIIGCAIGGLDVMIECPEVNMNAETIKKTLEKAFGQ